MRQLFVVFLAASIFTSCGNTKSNAFDTDRNKEKNKLEKNSDEETVEENDGESDSSTLGNWSDEDKDKLRKEWAKTFAQWKDGLQGEDDFNEEDFDKEAKKVSNCTLKIFENKFESYAKYKKASNRDHFQSDPDLLNEVADCQERMMNKYNRESQSY